MSGFRAAIQGETNIEDPGGFGILKMESGLVATVCAGNSLSGGASIRLYASVDFTTVIIVPGSRPSASATASATTSADADGAEHAVAHDDTGRYGTQANAVVTGTTITVSFFGEVSSTGQIVGEPRTEVGAKDVGRLRLAP